MRSSESNVSEHPEFRRGYEWAMRWGWREKCLKAEAEVRRLQEKVKTQGVQLDLYRTALDEERGGKS